MNKPLTTMTVDGLTWYSEDDWKALVAENAKLKAMIADQINSAGDDPEIMAATRAEWAARARAAEDKLAKAVEAFDCWANLMENPKYGIAEMVAEFDDIVFNTLVELKGEE